MLIILSSSLLMSLCDLKAWNDGVNKRIIEVKEKLIKSCVVLYVSGKAHMGAVVGSENKYLPMVMEQAANYMKGGGLTCGSHNNSHNDPVDSFYSSHPSPTSFVSALRAFENRAAFTSQEDTQERASVIVIAWPQMRKMPCYRCQLDPTRSARQMHKTEFWF